MAENRWDFCTMCGPMVICGHCGNNCCNGGSGTDCPDRCASAYAMQEKGPPNELPADVPMTLLFNPPA